MTFNKTAWHALGRRVGMVAISVLQAHSKGSVALVSSDPAREPKVAFNVLSDSRDYERLVAGLRFTLGLLTEPSVAAMHGEIFLPEAAVVESLARRDSWNALKARAIATILDRAWMRDKLLGSSRIDPEKLLGDEKALREFVRRCGAPQAHDSGTCRMGRADDADAVVDGCGRVHGIASLRIVDASIFPTVPTGYPHFIVIATAEKIADTIRAEWGSAGTKIQRRSTPQNPALKSPLHISCERPPGRARLLIR